MKAPARSAAASPSSRCPYAWLLVFFLLPFLVVARISVSEMEATTIKDIVSWKDGAIAISAKLGNYLLLVAGRPLPAHLRSRACSTRR